MNKLAFNIFLLILSLLVVCAIPTDPLKNYDESTLEFLGTEDDTVSYIINDSVVVSIEMRLPHLFDSITVSHNDDDSLITADYDEKFSDTLKLVYVFTQPETLSFAVSAIKSNGDKVTLTKTFIILGAEPDITTDLNSLYQIDAGEACTLTVEATGSAPLEYQWFKDEEAIENATGDTLIFPYFQDDETGTYFCVVSNEWGTDSSTSAVLILKKESDKETYWNFSILLDSLPEGDTITIDLDDRYTAPEEETVAFSFLSDSVNSSFSGDSQFVFFAGNRDSGSYSFPVAITSETEADTALISLKVYPRYCSLTVVAESGTVSADPERETYRWGDTITLTATADDEFRFVEWSGDAAGNDDELSIVIFDDYSIEAVFVEKDHSGCVELHSGSLNQAIRNASPSTERPSQLCPAEGLYDDGTIKVSGTVRFIFQ